MSSTEVTLDRARVIGAYVLPLLEMVRDAGFSFEDLARLAGMEPKALHPLPERISVRNYLQLLNAGATLTNDPHFGLNLGARMFAPAHAVYGMILQSCRTFAEALAQAQRYESLAHDMGRTTMQIDNGSVLISWVSPIEQVNQCAHVAECIVASFQTLAIALARQPVPIMEVGFVHDRPTDSAVHERMFDCPVSYQQPANFGRMAIELLNWPLPYATSDLLPILVQHADQLLLERQRGGAGSVLEQTVKDAIIRELKFGRSSLANVAPLLGLSVRTLQRKLQAVDLHYRTLLDSTRRELAQHYLRTTKISLTEIAFLVGFQEQSSFNHAFRQWTGTTPTLWRTQHGINA
jgi:AraC-like DNA-binding protein